MEVLSRRISCTSRERWRDYEKCLMLHTVIQYIGTCIGNDISIECVLKGTFPRITHMYYPFYTCL